MFFSIRKKTKNQKNIIKKLIYCKKNKKRLVQTSSSLALVYQEMWKIIEDKKSAEAKKILRNVAQYQKEAINMLQDIFAGKKHANMASAYNMAVLQNSLGNYEMAVFYYKKTEDIRISLLNIYIVDLAVTYFGLGRNYIDMANTETKIRKQLIYLFKIDSILFGEE